MNIFRMLFGSRAQIIVGVSAFIAGVGIWVYFEYVPPDVRAVFRVSMFFGLAACYAIIATGLDHRATERVERHVARGGGS